MLGRLSNWVIYGDCSQEPSDNIEFLKGLVPSDPKLRLRNPLTMEEVKK
jgi:hypothetical protein